MYVDVNAGSWICKTSGSAICEWSMWVKFWTFIILICLVKWLISLHYEMTLAQNGSLCSLNCSFLSCLCAIDSSFVPPLIYAVLGSSRDIAIGPVAVVSLLLGTLLKQEVSLAKEPTTYLHLAFTATFFAGIFQTGLGILRSVRVFNCVTIFN